MWHIGNITPEYFTISSVNVTLQFSCVTAVIIHKGMFLSSYSEHKCHFPGVFKQGERGRCCSVSCLLKLKYIFCNC